MEEIIGLIKTLTITRPKRKTTATDFMNKGFNEMEDAIKNKNWAQFERSFFRMRQECIICHNKNEHAFIIPQEVPSKGGSPALD